MYNYTVVLVAISTSTRELRETEKNPEEMQGLSLLRLKDLLFL